ncbi:MAG TPA: hypothetical protein PKY82_09020 [Pyrinomonadaceae bacterium]|nr:hypothetical protein [Pyrinomonadaceae bacterium]
MKRYSFWIIIALFSFSIGLCAVLAWLYYGQKDIVEIEPILLLDNSCIQSKSYPGLSKKISELQKGKSGYFPKGTWKSFDIADLSMNEWYGKFLKSMDETSLLDVSDNTEVYRFLWLRSFHHPIFVRIERNGNSIQLFSKELDGGGGYEPGKVLRQEHKILDEQQWCGFLNLLGKSNYWQMPVENNEVLGNDGSQWILEGVKDGRYHVVDRWTPKNGEYREACIYLLKLSGVDVDRLKEELY